MSDNTRIEARDEFRPLSDADRAAYQQRQDYLAEHNRRWRDIEARRSQPTSSVDKEAALWGSILAETGLGETFAKLEAQEADAQALVSAWHDRHAPSEEELDSLSSWLPEKH